MNWLWISQPKYTWSDDIIVQATNYNLKTMSGKSQDPHQNKEKGHIG